MSSDQQLELRTDSGVRTCSCSVASMKERISGVRTCKCSVACMKEVSVACERFCVQWRI